jgi:Transposase DDE domain
MFKDERRVMVWESIRQQGLRPFAKRLSPDLVAQAAEQASVLAGKGPLNLATMSWLGLLSALHLSKNFADILRLGLKLLRDAEDWRDTPVAAEVRKARKKSPRNSRRRSKHDPRPLDPTAISEGAFAQARERIPLSFWMALTMVLGRQFQSEHPRCVRWRGFRLLALDGTEIALPRWKRLQDYYGTARNGSGGRVPKARLVALALPLARMTCQYELGTHKQSEKTLAARLLPSLQPRDLLLIDRGFWSYGLFCQTLQRKAHFAIRQFGNVKFRTLRRLGPRDRIVCWRPSDRKWKTGNYPESLELRVINYRIPGFRPSAIVTSLLDDTRVSGEDWVRLATQNEAGQSLAPGVYHRRWEIETMFRELKATQGLAGRFRSRTGQGIQFEIAGHILLHQLVRWLMADAARIHGVDDPLRLSYSHALKELLEMRQDLVRADSSRLHRVLLPRLLKRIAAVQVPLRPGRHYPRPNDSKIKNLGYGKKRLPAKLVKKVA